MKTVSCSSFFFAFCFICLFLTGFTRLYSQTDDNNPAAATAVQVECAFSADSNETKNNMPESVKDGCGVSVQKNVSARPEERIHLSDNAAVLKDSNGDILRKDRYSVSFLNCFAPEEGFS